MVTSQAELSYRLHEAVLPYLHSDWPTAAGIIRDNLDWLRSRPRATLAMSWVEQWERALESGPDAVADVAMTPGERGDDLRQVSPLAGVLPQDVREQVLRTVRSATV